MKSKLLFVALLFVSTFCGRDAAAQSPNVRLSYKDVVGTYRDPYGSLITVDRAPSGMIAIEYRGVYKGRMPGSVNVGAASATTKLIGDTAIFVPADAGSCRITLVFKRGRLEAAQQGNDIDCGFGANVNASGTYKRTSRLVQRFAADDPFRELKPKR